MQKYLVKKAEAIVAKAEDPKRTLYVYADEELGANNLSGGSADIPVNSQLPYHVHESEEEMMFIYRGTGELVVEGETFPLEPETMVFIPKGLKHTFKNTGEEPLSFCFFYAPPGPEKNIRKMATGNTR